MKTSLRFPLNLAAAAVAGLISATPAQAVNGVYDKYFVTTQAQSESPGGAPSRGFHYYNERSSAINALPGTQFGGGTTYVNTGSSFDTTGRLTAATSFAATSGLINGNPTGDANRTIANADLSTGNLRAEVLSSSPDSGFVSGQAFAQMHDIVTLNIAGAGADTRTRITVQYKVDGGFAVSGPIAAGNVPQALVTSRMVLNNPNSAQGGLVASSVVAWNTDLNQQVPTLTVLENGFTNAGDVFNTGDVNGAGSWAGSTPTLMVFTGSFDLIGSSVTLNPTFTLDVNCTWATCDFGHTARFRFVDLPANVSFTSNSGVFLAAVPEPSTYALMLAGLVAVGTYVQRQRRQGSGALRA